MRIKLQRSCVSNLKPTSPWTIPSECRSAPARLRTFHASCIAACGEENQDGDDWNASFGIYTLQNDLVLWRS